MQTARKIWFRTAQILLKFQSSPPSSPILEKLQNFKFDLWWRKLTILKTWNKVSRQGRSCRSFQKCCRVCIRPRLVLHSLNFSFEMSKIYATQKFEFRVTKGIFRVANDFKLARQVFYFDTCRTLELRVFEMRFWSGQTIELEGRWIRTCIQNSRSDLSFKKFVNFWFD